MTRDEFDRSFRAYIDNTAGYPRSVLNAINDTVFTEVADLDVNDIGTKSIVDHKFARAFALADSR